ncbi:MAG: AAA-like domain-containing protein [Fimbriimonas ginsengisoli]|uniref:AAA-like domain-containing protein n=1 Tax=Fimbriimonas ginsengisoli TaxID=1005039 RepID=A0A931LW24_FIMGI|nr:AAA-like domain-containing protein [Fimbriimonas ginsengisoli]
MDLVGYSRESTAGQAKLIGELTRLVSVSPTFAEARGTGGVLPLPTGDGMALLYTGEVTAPARSALELWTPLREAGLRVRMGLHSGLVQRQTDIAGHANVAGEGINTAQRVMDLGEEGHILASDQYASWLGQSETWKPRLRLVGIGRAKHGVLLKVHCLSGDGFGRPEAPPGVRAVRDGEVSMGQDLAILYRRGKQQDEQVMGAIEAHLSALGHRVFVDRHLKIGVEWAKAIEERIRASDAVVAILSDASTGSEMLEYELETALDEHRSRGKPAILPVRLGSSKPLEGSIGAIVNPLNFTVWDDAEDDRRVAAEIASAIAEPLKAPSDERMLEPVGGAVPPDSSFYVEREADAEFLDALGHNESIVLVKGPRQMGKTSMLGRGAKLAREQNWSTALTDFQKVGGSQLASEDAFYRLLAATLARQFKFSYDFESEWLEVFGANMNLDNFVRALAEASDGPIVWFMDEADRLFGIPFASDFFGLIRSWHNSRATESNGPWGKLTVVIAYATEAHLFIQDLNQSPFNVGRQFELCGFTLEQTEDLNGRYGSPLRSGEEVRSLYGLIAGQPFLTRRALDVLARGSTDFARLLSTADRDDGPFGDHLKRILIAASRLPSVADALRNSLSCSSNGESEGLHRLVAAGIFKQGPDGSFGFCCELYRRYLAGHMPVGSMGVAAS